MEEKMIGPVWVTKYALTKGVHRYKEVILVSPTMVCLPGKCPVYLHRGDWYDTEEKALEKAQRMLLSKELNLEKQLRKIREMKIKVVEV